MFAHSDLDRLGRLYFDACKTVPLDSDSGGGSGTKPMLAIDPPGTKPPASDCHTAMPGGTCYSHVHWAKNEGIYSHEEWYPGLTRHSSMKDFQQALHERHHGECPKPC